jgi:hypothetical protein
MEVLFRAKIAICTHSFPNHSERNLLLVDSVALSLRLEIVQSLGVISCGSIGAADMNLHRSGRRGIPPKQE